MSDIFQEVDEEVRRDKAAEFWKKHQNLIIGAAALIVLATAGFRFYENRRLEAEQAAGAAFQQALALDRDGKGAEADAAMAKLAADAPRGYQTLARLAEAAIKAKTDPKGALAAYDALAADASIGALFQEAARLRAALLRLDVGESEAAKPALEALGGKRRRLSPHRAPGPRRHRARREGLRGRRQMARSRRRRRGSARLRKSAAPKTCSASSPPTARRPSERRAPKRLRAGAAVFESSPMSAKVAIIGRPNVGKSTLFNRLVGRKLALVDDQPGVTRDRREGEARLGDLAFTIVDTAGLEEGDGASLAGRMRAQTEAALADCDAILFLIDARAGVTGSRPAFRAGRAPRRQAGHPDRQQGRGARRASGRLRGLRARPRRPHRVFRRTRRGLGRTLRRARRRAAAPRRGSTRTRRTRPRR